MRRYLRRWGVFIIVLSLLMSMSAAPAEVHAASKVTETVLNKKKVTLTVGETVQLKLKNAPKDKAVTWSSSKKSVAAVGKKGKVKAKKAGTAKVTAKVNNKSYSCTVTVKKFALSNTKGKNVNDVKALNAIIQEQNAQGANLPADLNNKKYVWDEKGNLIELNWTGCDLKGSLSLNGLASLSCFNCNGNDIISLDLSTCTALTLLYCHNNQISSLDLSACTALTGLGCSYNQLNSLDLSKNVTLTYLNCKNNPLSNLNVSACTELMSLECSDNQLSSLDVSKNAALAILNCSGNQLSSLDVSACTVLNNLSCENNQLSNLDLSKNIALMYLNCSKNEISSLDLSACKKMRSLEHDPNVTIQRSRK